MIAMREDLKAKEIQKEHFLKAMETVKPSVDKETEEKYEELQEYFATARAKQIKEEKMGYVG